MDDKQMKVFLATFPGRYLGGDALVVAPTKRQAFNYLKKGLGKLDLPKGRPLSMDDLCEVDLTQKHSYLIDDGDY